MGRTTRSSCLPRNGPKKRRHWPRFNNQAVLGRNGYNYDCSQREPDVGLAVIFEPAARRRRDRAADHVFVRGFGGAGYALADSGAVAGFSVAAPQIWIAVSFHSRVGPDRGAVWGVAVYLRDVSHGHGFVGDCGTPGDRSGDFSS